MLSKGKMNIKQAGRCAMDFMDFSKPDAKNRVFVEFTCKIHCEFRTMCFEMRRPLEKRLNGGLK